LPSTQPTFQDATAVITGGAGGLGRAITAALAERGTRVAALDLSPAPEPALGIECDVTDAQQVEHAVSAAVQQLGPVRMLVCAAGVVSEHPLSELEPAEWHRVVDASLTSAFLAARAVAPSMAANGGGSMVTFSSGRSRGYLHGPHYAAAKAGVEALTRSLALELAPQAIRVNCISPGPVRTPMLGSVGDYDEEDRRARIPLGRIGEPEDIAGPVLFLLGPESAYVTGQVLPVNGGMQM
jgi:NAD(P)-dependent dehydrogenase (short-subunit alcohol dehydrogenase family)